ncbi:MAG: hypothetical protein JJU45_04220 [Acidimicrobiia bacterium]|nr:hypothetical protein [Acidimicrobiia bacterium]
MARRDAERHGLGEGDVVVRRSQLEELAGRLYCLEAAIEDTEEDLATAGDDPTELRRMLDWLLVNARPAAAGWHESMAR